MSFVVSAIAGLGAGIISGWGVGGGTLLMIFMTAVQGYAQQTAQGINLLYFIPTSLAALYSHVKNGLVEKKAAIPAIIAGTASTLAAALTATALDTGLLKKIFGVFLIIIGMTELFKK